LSSNTGGKVACQVVGDQLTWQKNDPTLSLFPSLAASEGEGEGEGEQETATYASVDSNRDNAVGLTELLRVIQLYNSDGFHCDATTEDGYALGPGDTSCAAYSEDFSPRDWHLGLTELLRVIQFYNAGGYHSCPDQATEDGFCAGSSANTR
jgi:hypothetical protein